MPATAACLCPAGRAAQRRGRSHGVPTSTARQVVERIKENVHCAWSEKTVDTFKSGDPDAPATGVAMTFLATLDVLQQAVASGKNLVITHEPTFYNHVDDTKRFESDEVDAATCLCEEPTVPVEHTGIDLINKVRQSGYANYPGRDPRTVRPETAK